MAVARIVKFVPPVFVIPTGPKAVCPNDTGNPTPKVRGP
jgi:hypothetical protein